MDSRFASPKGDLAHGCRQCHLVDEDPQGLRAYTDFQSRSWMPWRPDAPERTEPRNSPTLLDVELMPRLHWDGEFDSLEGLVKGTLTGRNMGWLPPERTEALSQIRGVLLKDVGEGPGAEGSYRQQFRATYGIDLEDLSAEESLDWIARSIADYMGSLRTRREAPYDAFIRTNALDDAPGPGENPKSYSKRLLDRVEVLEAQGRLALVDGFSEQALAGFKIFFRPGGLRSAGNCVVCHTPPLFTDFKFHNTGITQAEYDRVHGAGGFERLPIPGPEEIDRPAERFRRPPDRSHPDWADLGFWNFVDPANSPLRLSTETETEFLARMIATFKTPTLRNLALTGPYMHNGAFATLEAALEAVVSASELARSGRRRLLTVQSPTQGETPSAGPPAQSRQLRSGDVEFALMTVSRDDIPRLLTFLQTLNEPYD